MSSITHLSPTLPVHMSDSWFDIATLDHFWIKRRFEVFLKVWKSRKLNGRVAEIGCGHGLVLKQIEKAFGVQTDGYDLNEQALKQADPNCGRLFYYNIHDREASLKNVYDTIFLFDVIEHLEDDKGFIESVLFHLKAGGFLVINVPALQSLYSDYDRVVGHQRRYDISELKMLCAALDLDIEAWSFWGLSYIPVLVIRKQMLVGVPDAEVIRRGMSPQSRFSNDLMLRLGRLEFLPNHWTGTSLLAVIKSKA